MAFTVTVIERPDADAEVPAGHGCDNSTGGCAGCGAAPTLEVPDAGTVIGLSPLED